MIEFDKSKKEKQTIMWKTIASLLLRIFGKSALGTLISKLLKSVGNELLKQITDNDNQKKAYEFVKELNARTDLNCIQKAAEFNKKMIAWGHSIDKEMKESVINCLRELAVNAIKAELGE